VGGLMSYGSTTAEAYRQRATATTLDCLWMMPRDPDADMCSSTETVLVSTEECMAHQGCVPFADHQSDRSNPGAVHRVISQVRV